MLLIGDAARLVGVSPSALRLWERQGLIGAARTPGGERRYGPAELARLKRVARLRRVDGLNAPAIRRLLDRNTALGRHRSRVPASASPAGPAIRVSAASPQSQDGVPDHLDIPSRLRALRIARGMTLRAAADGAGLSVSFVSAVERGLTGVSVAALKRLVSIYGATLGDLLHDAATAPARLVPAARRRVLEATRGVRIEDLASRPTALESQLFVLAPGAGSNGAYAHDGEEFMFLLDGSLGVWLDETEYYELNPGDALTFPSTLTHRFEALGPTETRLLWVNTPPTF
jgi:DNA-binding transcriptional MerR regulator/mannose-6-phosphate isomerase-like protein (cupin superfamily)